MKPIEIFLLENDLKKLRNQKTKSAGTDAMMMAADLLETLSAVAEIHSEGTCPECKYNPCLNLKLIRASLKDKRYG